MVSGDGSNSRVPILGLGSGGSCTSQLWETQWKGPEILLQLSEIWRPQHSGLCGGSLLLGESLRAEPPVLDGVKPGREGL